MSLEGQISLRRWNVFLYVNYRNDITRITTNNNNAGTLTNAISSSSKTTTSIGELERLRDALREAAQAGMPEDSDVASTATRLLNIITQDITSRDVIVPPSNETREEKMAEEEERMEGKMQEEEERIIEERSKRTKSRRKSRVKTSVVRRTNRRGRQLKRRTNDKQHLGNILTKSQNMPCCNTCDHARSDRFETEEQEKNRFWKFIDESVAIDEKTKEGTRDSNTFTRKGHDFEKKQHNKPLLVSRNQGIFETITQEKRDEFHLENMFYVSRNNFKSKSH